MNQYILFGGKGGVGKTTCAAAAALYYAKQGKTLIVSTDPAHSLSDSFEKKLSAKETEIFPNLFAVEIDPSENLESLKEKLGAEAPEDLKEQLGSMGMDQLVGGLGDIANMPGMDEMTAFDKFLQYIDSEEYDYVVFDTAPTGHTLKFLSLPETMDSWVGRMLKFRMQLSNAMGMFKQLLPYTQTEEKDKSLEHLEEMKKRIEKGRQVLTNPNQTEFVLVMLPQEMSILESERALKEIEKFGISIKKVVVNQVQPEEPGCDFCNERHKVHKKKTEQIKKKFSKQKHSLIPLFKKEIKGKENLEEFSKFLFEN